MVAMLFGIAHAAWSQGGGPTSAARVGVVILHGKGGQPTGLVAELATYLQSQGFQVRNLEMPWSGKRQYDASPVQAQQEVVDAFDELGRGGALRRVLVGHSQGGVFALHLAGVLPLDAVVAIAPGGNTGTELFAQKLGTHLAAARAQISAGHPDETGDFFDYEGSKGLIPVRTRADWYAAWFDPEGVMRQERALRAVSPAVPVLYLAPTGDLPTLKRLNPGLFSLLPKHPQTRWEQPAASHTDAPTAARERIGQWIADVVPPASNAW